MIITPEAETYRVNALYVTGQSVSKPYRTVEEAEKRITILLKNEEGNLEEQNFTVED